MQRSIGLIVEMVKRYIPTIMEIVGILIVANEFVGI
jgi:hypothetical protein